MKMFNFPYREKLSSIDETESEAEVNESLLPDGGKSSERKRSTSQISLLQVVILVATHLLVLAIGVVITCEYTSHRSRYSIEKIQNYCEHPGDGIRSLQLMACSSVCEGCRREIQ